MIYCIKVILLAAEYLGYHGGSTTTCARTSVIVKKDIVRTKFKALSNSNDITTLTTIGRGCTSGEVRLTASSTNATNTRPYLSKRGSEWIIYPVKGRDCSLVNIVSRKRELQGNAAYLSAPFSCSERGVRLVSMDSGNGRQQWSVEHA